MGDGCVGDLGGMADLVQRARPGGRALRRLPVHTSAERVCDSNSDACQVSETGSVADRERITVSHACVVTTSGPGCRRRNSASHGPSNALSGAMSSGRSG